MELYTLQLGESIEVRAFPRPGEKGLQRVQRFVPSWDEMYEVSDQLETDYDVYFGVAPRSAGSDGELHGRADNIRRLPVLWLDLDAKGGFTKDDRLEQLTGAPVLPSTVVDSGGGLHAYWQLDPVALDPSVGRGVMRAMAAAFRCDDTSDPPRILRVPGTRNHKTSPSRFVDVMSLPWPTTYPDLEKIVLSWPPAELPTLTTTQTTHRAQLIETFGVAEGGSAIEGEHFEGRDAAIFELACFLRDDPAMLDKDPLQRLEAANQKMRPPLPESVIRTKLRSAMTREAAPIITEVVEAPKLVTSSLVSSAETFPTTSIHSLGEPRATTWIWEPYVPENRLILLDGEEGIGKGLGCSYLAALFSAHRPFLWFSAEDDPTDDLQPRIFAAAKYFDVPPGELHVDFVNNHPLLNVENTAIFDVLEKTLESKEAKVLVFDPGRSYLGPRVGQRDFSMNNEADIRPTLQRLNRLSRDLDVSVIFVHHWNKNSGAPMKLRTSGSAAFRQVVRLQLSMLWDPSTEEGAFGVHKSNIGPTGSVRTYKIEAVGDTAVFVPSVDLDECATLEIWGKQREKAMGPVIVIEPTEVVEKVRDWAFLNLDKGDRFPAREDLMKQANITRDQARMAIEAMFDEGWIVRGKGTGAPYTWTPAWVPGDGVVLG